MFRIFTRPGISTFFSSLLFTSYSNPSCRAAPLLPHWLVAKRSVSCTAIGDRGALKLPQRVRQTRAAKSIFLCFLVQNFR